MVLTALNFVIPLCLTTVVLFGAIAYYSYMKAIKSGALIQTTDFFLTARNSQPWHRVAWGFYATSIGAGVIFAVPSFVVDPNYGGGWIGLIFYSLFSGLPLILIAYLGLRIKSQFPEVLSIGSYSRWRFGPYFQCWVTVNVLLNLGIALTVEFTAIGALYTTFLNQPAWIPISVVAVVTMIYTAAGGLYISLLTDYFQSAFIFLLLAIMGIFVSINFRPGPLGPLPSYLGVNEVGIASFVTLGVALTSSSMFSDAVWQRVWAAKDEKALMKGSFVGAILVIIVTFIFGLGGFLAAWAGLVTNPNTAFLELLKSGDSVKAVPIGMLVIICLLASTVSL